MSSDCTDNYSTWATNVCEDDRCYADYNCASKCCNKNKTGIRKLNKCSTDPFVCMDNYPTYTGCGYTGCVSSKDDTTSGNWCDGEKCASDNDCASKCCDNVSDLPLCTHDYNKCMIKEGNCPEVPPTPTPPSPSPSPSPSPIPSGGGDAGSSLTWLWILISSLIVVAIILVIFFVRRKRVQKTALVRNTAYDPVNNEPLSPTQSAMASQSPL